MKNVLKLTATLALVALLGGPLSTSPALAQDDGTVFEMRTYTSTPGNFEALLTRFRDHTMRIFAKHGMTNIGYWIPTDEELSQNTLVYILKHDSQDAATASWRAFISDPEWQEVDQASNADGAILQNIERQFMTAADFSQIQ